MLALRLMSSRVRRSAHRHLKRFSHSLPVSCSELKGYEPGPVEEGWYAWWESMGLFKPQSDYCPHLHRRTSLHVCPQGQREPRQDTHSTGVEQHNEAYWHRRRFSTVLPPPNVTGSLHLGHALTVTIQDVIVRYMRMVGRNTVYIPGLDHAGIATQSVVERELLKGTLPMPQSVIDQLSGSQTRNTHLKGLTRHDLGRNNFIDAVWRWKEDNGSYINSQLRQMGGSLDWSRHLFTMDANSSAGVEKAFIHLWDTARLRRRIRLVSYCPKLRTTLSQIEVDSMPVSGPALTKTSVGGDGVPVCKWKREMLEVPGPASQIEVGVMYNMKMLPVNPPSDWHAPSLENIFPNHTLAPDHSMLLPASDKPTGTGRRTDTLTDTPRDTGLSVPSVGDALCISTTRPETLLGDVCVCVHPDDVRYQALIGSFVRQPVTGRLLPVIADPTLVDMTKGSGVVKVTPAHDENDLACLTRWNGFMKRLEGLGAPRSSSVSDTVDRTVTGNEKNAIVNSHTDDEKTDTVANTTIPQYVRMCADRLRQAMSSTISPEDTSFQQYHNDRSLQLPCVDVLDVAGEVNERGRIVDVERTQDSITVGASDKLVTGPTCGSVSDEENEATIWTIPEQYHGVDRLVARQQIVAELSETDSALPSMPHTATLDICSRSGDLIEPKILPQWFVKTREMADDARNLVARAGHNDASAHSHSGVKDSVHIFPSSFRNVWEEYLSSDRSDHWCVSRQLWWGHQIPAFRITLSEHPDSCPQEGAAQRECWVAAPNARDALCKAVDLSLIHIAGDHHGTSDASGLSTEEQLFEIWDLEWETMDALVMMVNENEYVHVQQDPDVLDTWFSSGLFPLTALGWPGTDFDNHPTTPDGDSAFPSKDHTSAHTHTPNHGSGLDTFYPLSMLETGGDILFFWVARMIMLCRTMTVRGDKLVSSRHSHADSRCMMGVTGDKLGGDSDSDDDSAGVSPFDRVLLHMMIRDKYGAKMSKSKGNVVDPISLIDGTEDQPALGSDAVRLALALYLSQARSNIHLDTQRVHVTRKLCNKIWQAGKFVRGQTQAALQNHSNLMKSGTGSALMAAINVAKAQSADGHLWLDVLGDAIVFDPLSKLHCCPHSHNLFDLWIGMQLANAIDKIHSGFQQSFPMPTDGDHTSSGLSDRRHEQSDGTHPVYTCAQTGLGFITSDFCDWYVELKKCPDAVKFTPTFSRLSEGTTSHNHESGKSVDDSGEALLTLPCVFECALRMLHPVTPFVSEELWQILNSELRESVEAIDLGTGETEEWVNGAEVSRTPHQHQDQDVPGRSGEWELYGDHLRSVSGGQHAISSISVRKFPAGVNGDTTIPSEATPVELVARMRSRNGAVRTFSDVNQLNQAYLEDVHEQMSVLKQIITSFRSLKTLAGPAMKPARDVRLVLIVDPSESNADRGFNSARQTDRQTELDAVTHTSLHTDTTSADADVQGEISAVYLPCRLSAAAEGLCDAVQFMCRVGRYSGDFEGKDDYQCVSVYNNVEDAEPALRNVGSDPPNVYLRAQVCPGLTLRMYLPVADDSSAFAGHLQYFESQLQRTQKRIKKLTKLQQKQAKKMKSKNYLKFTPVQAQEAARHQQEQRSADISALEDTCEIISGVIYQLK